MKKALYTIGILCLGLLIASPTLIKIIGGNFQGSPEQMEGKLSQGAKDLIAGAFKNITQGALRDHHMHVIGLDEAKGTFINPKLLTWRHPVHRIKSNVYLSASTVSDFKIANKQYLARVIELARNITYNGTYMGGKYHALAFDHYYNMDGTLNKAKSEFYTSNQYVYDLGQKYPDLFVPVISVHPARKDAVEALESWGKKGVKWIKWLPNAQGINAASTAYDAYYQTVRKFNMTILTHVGEEQAVEAEEDQALGNPLLFRRPLDLGVRIVMAHCASLGTNKDLDNPGQKRSSFDLFMRMMDNPKYEKYLYGEISATTQFNRLPTPLMTLLKRTDLHKRLVNGSDYPLPAINMIIHTRALVKHGLISKQERTYLNEIYGYNPLLFDFVVKRTLKHPDTGAKFAPSVFDGL